MDTKDDWPDIYNKILEAKILLFATPIWWNNHSSELQRCIERLDEVYDIMLKGEDSPLDGKIGGELTFLIITPNGLNLTYYKFYYEFYYQMNNDFSPVNSDDSTNKLNNNKKENHGSNNNISDAQ